MSLHFSPWVGLVLGILLGWVMEWLLELFSWRLRRLACQRRLAEVEALLNERATQVKNVTAHITSLKADLADLRSRTAPTASQGG